MLRMSSTLQLESPVFSQVTYFCFYLNQGSVKVRGKAVNRGGGLGMEIPCVYIFDGPRKHVDLLEQLLDVNNNPAILAEDDPGTARSKQTTSKRKKVKSNDCNKKPRK